MAQSSSGHNLWNLFLGGKNNLTGTTPNKDNNIYAVLHAHTLVPANASLVGSALSSVAKYL